MKIESLPEYAKKYKVKGYDVKKVGNEYYQYKVEHHRVKDKKYPVTKFVYIGKIDKNKGLIKAGNNFNQSVECYLEFGLSNYLFKYYKRAIQRSLFNCSGEIGMSLIKLGIIQYIFNNVSKVTLRSSYLTFKECDVLYDFYISNEQNKVKVLKVSNKISSCLKLVFIDDEERDIILNSLRNMNAYITSDKEKINKVVSNDAKAIFERLEVKYE